MVKSLKKYVISCIVVLFMIFFMLPDHVQAATLIKKGNFENVSNNSYFLNEFVFTPSQEGYFVIYCIISNSYGTNLSAQDGLVVTIDSDDGFYNEFKWKAGNGWPAMWCVDNSSIPISSNVPVSVCFRSLSNSYLDIEYEIYLYKELTTSISIPSTIDLKTEQTQKIKISNQVPNDSHLDMEIISSNDNIASPYFDYYSHSWYVQANRSGTCTLIAKLRNGRQYSCKVTVTNPNAKLRYTSCTMNVGHTVTNKMLYTNQKVKWSSSNKKIATVSSKGIIKAKKIGKCTITAQVGKKKYKCTIKVVRRNPNFSGYIEDYYTRNNYFAVRIKNMGDATLTILSSGVKAKNYDYKSFDRNLKVSTTTIKPGKTKTLKFKVKGRTTWYDHEDFWITYKFKYDGKTYSGRLYADPEDSDFKNGSKYYYTYLGGDCGF